ncbi:T9SS type A sorting domain-containing protein [uncultured Aquimarina sp.]|uniref:T9SS type A sorting domain-containing protein n=1 Tax=uncultured Aquimarina sp. TaxID=575652 RepID=UPI0026142535|nr:T9SS type A sorting domain-containing protein [uncultured Aquimarina sp.]
MRKLLPFVLAVFLISFNDIVAQTGNQISGAAITPNQSNTSNTPFPYDGRTTFTPGSSLTTGDWNLSIGPGAGASLISDSRNILIGGMAGAKLTDRDNIVIGTFAADQTEGNFDNVYIGNYVARYATGSDNVVIGHRAGQVLTIGFDNVVIGEQAGFRLTEGRDNVLIGEDAGYELTTGNDNCFVGSNAGLNTTTASGNTFVGGEGDSNIPSTLGNGSDYDFVLLSDGAGERNRTGAANTFVGSGAGMDNVDGFANTFLGYAAGANNQHADGNTFLGYGAGWDNNRTNERNNANRNTYIGVLTGGINREGSDNIGMGWKADFSGNGAFGPSDNRNQRNIFLGNSVSVFGDDQVIIGHQARSTGNKGSITIGSQSSTGGSYAAAIGYDVDVAEANTMALGGNTTTNRMSLGIGTVAANQNASLELADTDKGFLINRLTTAERTAMETTAGSGNALTTTDTGLMVYDTDLSALFLWNGTQWINSTIDTDTDDQTIDEFQLNGNDLELSLQDDSEATKAVDLSKYLDNTDTQRIDTLMLSRNKMMISLENDNEKFKEIDLSWFLQALSLSSNTLSISGNPSTVDLSGYLDNTDSQELSFSTNTLSLSGGTNTVDLSSYLDNTDAQDLELSGNVLSLTNDNTVVDLSGYLDNTDSQELSFSTNTLSLSGGTNSVDLSDYLDNTDMQDLELSNNILSLTNDGTSVDLSGYLDNTDAQTLTLSNGNLTISGGNSIDISSLQDGTGTDSQTLDLINDTLSISNGNSVDFSPYINTDGQDLTSASLVDTNLTIEIENGASVTVDPSPLLTNLSDRLAALEQTLGVPENNLGKAEAAILYQNIPNPFNGTSSIKYYVPNHVSSAAIVFSNTSGQVMSNVAIENVGDGELNINSDGLSAGTYFYTLYVEGRKIETKKMVIE